MERIDEFEYRRARVFDVESTCDYKKFDRLKLTKYNQHARRYWGAVEDIVRNDYSLEGWLILETFADAYSDTIKDCIRLHYAWLDDNLEELFNYRKYHKHLSRKFPKELAAVRLDLTRRPVSASPPAPRAMQ